MAGQRYRRALRRGLTGAPPTTPAAAGRLLLAERALVEPQLHRKSRPGRHRPGADAEQLHDLVPVEVGSQRDELLLLAQLRDAGLQLVHAARQRPGLGGVAGRAVAAGQLVEPVELVAGVAHVAAHRLVGPAEPVGVEAQVQLHQSAPPCPRPSAE